MPPKHDLRGGNTSADSFAMSSMALVASMIRSFVAAGNRELAYAIAMRSRTFAWPDLYPTRHLA